MTEAGIRLQKNPVKEASATAERDVQMEEEAVAKPEGTEIMQDGEVSLAEESIKLRSRYRCYGPAVFLPLG